MVEHNLRSNVDLQAFIEIGSQSSKAAVNKNTTMGVKMEREQRL